MDRIDRIAGLLIIPTVLLIGFLLFTDGDDTETTEVLGDRTEAPGEQTDQDEAAEDADEPAEGSGATTPSTTADSETDAEAEGQETTATTTSTTASTDAGDDEASELPDADPAAPPQEPVGSYRNGKVVLRGSVPSAAVADGFAARAGSVLGEENVTVEMTLDPRVTAETMTIVVDQEFRFPSGGVVFDAEFEALLNLGAAALQLLPEATLVVTGHTDDVGDDGTNLALSQARAQVVVDWMVDRGIAPERVIARAAGESEPIADNTTPEGRDANRRVEAVLEGVTPS